NTIHRQILLTIDEMATEGIDWGYDAKYIDDQMDDMYWMIEGEKFNIQGRNEVTASSVVPLGLHLRDGGQNRISIDFLENVPDDTQIFIHDKVLDLYHDLRQSDYVFNLPAGEYLNRFEITFNNGESLNVDSTETNPLTVYFNNEQGNLVLLNPMLLKVNSIEIFNLLGQSLYNIKLSEPKRYSEYLLNNISTGTYIVKLNTGTGILSDKVLVK
ncbi:MAG TPA: T9SS type A sorting domain-containing protein, partial [Aquaticitalea sp.]|nr:T9SS type A sorting domain-containing protein [Aquaticitalea sp.]